MVKTEAYCFACLQWWRQTSRKQRPQLNRQNLKHKNHVSRDYRDSIVFAEKRRFYNVIRPYEHDKSAFLNYCGSKSCVFGPNKCGCCHLRWNTTLTNKPASSLSTPQLNKDWTKPERLNKTSDKVSKQKSFDGLSFHKQSARCGL